MKKIYDYIDQCLAYEQYAFTWDELKTQLNKSDSALRNELSRLTKKKEIISLRQGFYIIIPPRYKQYGRLPIELYVQKLFKYLNKPYYLAFYSAASFHGASHQQVQQNYLMTQIPNVRDIKKGNNYLNISATSNWPKNNIIKRKSDAGLFNISSPALTAIDLIHYQSKMGGLNRIITILEELTEAITAEDLINLLQWYPHTSTIQRLGFIFEEIQTELYLIKPIEEFLKTKPLYPILLSPENKNKPGKANNPWKVDRNIELESDL
ncbi:type IV toxin-antitoxin system AbiEi family antitoxin [Marivirga salinae]|uniref:Type IV toxin-antitoxin system AbiEi family antitoxin n=1 Tax=Marivirga salinarum TaxID=3059078 RepID=A0AA51NAT5_9BACT|nr:type IV toxin-antitoxin system AbiEi family antitoxin [Marivirga sp. BDSF4-3]WMN11723.1 type IV toxin-antitoxin system AbiEi family antitoxin [Marivirga sp. BDSF4-3]